MEFKSKTVFRGIKEYLIITVGLFLYTSGIIIFVIPNQLVGGGVTGIASIIYYATGFSVSYTYFLVNGLLLAIALKVLGNHFGVKTVFAIIVATLFLDLLPRWIPAEFIQSISIENGKLLSSVMGGAFAGLGIAMTFTQGGSTGGTDIVALMITKYRNISPGKIILLIDIVIIASSLLIPNDATAGERTAVIIYGYILIGTAGYTIDLTLSGVNQSVQVFIFSKKHEEIADRISQLGRGVTLIDGKGWFTKEENQILMVMLRRSESNMVFRIIRDIDRDAFMSIANVTGVYGKGFDQIKK